MHRPSYRSLQAIAVLAVLLAAGCGEDPRFSARTQYLGGTYGGAPAGPPQDNVSYWDGDNVSGKPSITISLREQRAYFYKSGVLVGVSQLSTGQEGLNTPSGRFSIIQKDANHFSSLFGDYVDSAGNVVVLPMSMSLRTRNQKAPASGAHRCPISCVLFPGRDCTQVICLVTRPLTAVSECLNSWPKTFSSQSHSERQSQSRIRFIEGISIWACRKFAAAAFS